MNDFKISTSINVIFCIILMIVYFSISIDIKPKIKPIKKLMRIEKPHHRDLKGWVETKENYITGFNNDPKKTLLHLCGGGFLLTPYYVRHEYSNYKKKIYKWKCYSDKAKYVFNFSLSHDRNFHKIVLK